MFEHANQFQVTMVQRSIINFSNTIDFFILFTVFFLTFNPKILGQTEGFPDSTFNTGSGFNDLVKDIELQSDGKILVSGAFTTYQNISANRIVRLNNNGSIDNTFVYSKSAEQLSLSKRNGTIYFKGAVKKVFVTTF